MCWVHLMMINSNYWQPELYLKSHCVKSVQIRSFFWSLFSHIRTEYGEILRRDIPAVWSLYWRNPWWETSFLVQWPGRKKDIITLYDQPIYYDSVIIREVTSQKKTCILTYFAQCVLNSKWNFLFFNFELITRKWENKSLTFELVTRSEIKIFTNSC